ncbi:MAG: hypothetical protein ACXAES_00780 [Promethearchaeota archaeon]|jgi:hypothetical protein
MDLARFLQIYVIQGGFALFFIFMAYLILKRSRRSTHLYLGGFYLSSTIGAVINIVYANIFNATIVYVLHFITYYILCFSLGFLFIFVLILIKPIDKFPKKKQAFILIVYAVLLLGLLLIPDGIKINKSTNWKPNWSWIFFIYSVVLCSSICILPTGFYSAKIYKKFENGHLKRKWKYLLLGVSAYFFLYYGTTLSNTLHNDVFRLLWSLVSLPTLISLFLIYYGVGRQLE